MSTEIRPERAAARLPLGEPTGSGSATARLARVLVTDADSKAGLALIRSLGRAGYEVLAASSHAGAAGFRSRHVSRRLLYPPPSKRTADFVKALRWAVTSLHLDLLIPVSDEALLPLAAARDQFEPHCRLALPHNPAVAAAASKKETLDVARRLGVPVPRSCLVSSATEAADCADELGYPAVLKAEHTFRFDTRDGVGRPGTVYANSRREVLLEADALINGGPLLVQEYVAGGAEGVEILARDGQPLLAFQHRRIREVPVTGGVSSMRESVPLDDELFAYACRLLAELRWMGLAMVEFKLTTQGPVLMEINGRPWGSIGLAVEAGADFPRLLADMLLGEGPPAAVGGYRVGLRSRNLELELLWAASVALGRRRYHFLPFPPRRAALQALTDLFRRGVSDDFLRGDDPLPGVVHLLGIVRRLGQRLLR